MAYLYLAKQIGIAVAFAAWAYIVAKGLFAGSSLRLSPVAEVALLVPVGLAVAIGLLFGLGIVGAFTGPWILAGAVLLPAFACWRLRDRFASGLSGLSGTLRAIACRETPARLAMALIAGVVLVPVALDALTPPYMSDEVRYHLPYALHFLEQGRIVPDLYLRYPFHTLNVNLLYGAALGVGDDVTPHYIHLLLGCLTGLALYVLAAPRCGRTLAFCAVLLFFVTPSFRLFAPTAMVDLGLAAFVTATLACLDRARSQPALVVCAGLAFGAALGTKYLALALLPLVVAWAAYRTRDSRQIARFALVAVLAGAPWYIYNLIWTGNPISPFAGEWLGSWPWTADDLAAQTRELNQWAGQRSLSDLLSLPYQLVFEPHRFRVQSVPAPTAFGLMALVLLPWWSPKIRPYGILVLVVVTVWFFTASNFRYLVAILPVWCLISVWSVERALWWAVSVVARRKVIPEAARGHVLPAAAAIVLVFVVYHFLQYSRWLDRDAVTERVVHRDRFLRERVPVYGVAEHLRRSGVRGETIFVFPPGALFSYARANRVVGDYFGPMGYSRKFIFNWVCPERLLERLQDISLMVISQEFLKIRPELKRGLGSRSTTEYADRYAVVFRIESGNEHPYEDPRQDSNTTGSRYDTYAALGHDTGHVVPYFPVASDGFVQGFVRIANHSDKAGTVVIHGIDDAGARYEPIPLALGARETRSFRADHLVACGFAKRVSGSPGEDEDEAGNWRFSLATELDMEALGYIRTQDGFMSSMHETARTTRGPDGRTIHHVPFFNPGRERSPASHLRLVNPGDREVVVTIAGRDDAGEASSEEVRLSLPGGTACRLGASALESGASGGEGSGCGITDGHLGSGQGRWRLSVAVTGGDIRVMSLLTSSRGHLTNLSASAGVRSGAHTLPLFLPAPDSDEEPQGLARIVNHSDAAGTVEIHGIDDTGAWHGPVTLALDGRQAVNLDSGDLEAGNPSKGLHEGLGDGAGYWRLRLATELDIEALAYARTRDGLLTSMHEVARAAPRGERETVHYVPFFNPGRNRRKASRMRLSNSGPRDVEVTIEGRDSAGMEAPGGVVSLTLPAGQACMLSARALESGKPTSEADTCTGEPFAIDGRLGRGAGKWSLLVIAEGGDVQVMSLLKTPSGHLANMSTSHGVPPAGRPIGGAWIDGLPEVAIAQVEQWGPQSGTVGEPFNVQPDGDSALWFRFLKLDRNRDYEIHVGSQPTVTTTNAERNLITAGLTTRQSRRLVSTEDRVPIYLVDPLRGKQLIGHFHIRPP